MEIEHSLFPSKVLIDPPILNSANPWATSLDDLRSLYKSPFTGAVTTRTCLVDGFAHDDHVHQYAFFDSSTHTTEPEKSKEAGYSSLNTLGYSPFSLDSYLDFIAVISKELQEPSDTEPQRAKVKPVIISVTGSPTEVRTCWEKISSLQRSSKIPLLMEINLSCPNISGKPPPAYSSETLKEYLASLHGAGVPLGLKTPPYTYHDQFKALIDAIEAHADKCRVSFITATNTLGSSLLLQHSETAPSDGWAPAINSATGSGIGGLAGASLHPLALGNVKLLSMLLKQRPQLEHIKLVGVGGVADAGGYWRMRSVGASAVGIGTAFGMQGLDVFRDVIEG